jgi:opacity protein-like surface antigen
MIKQNLRIFGVSLVALMTAALVLPGPSIAAEAEKGLYLQGQGGISFPEDSQVDTATRQDADLDNGFTGGVGFGYANGHGFRGEIGLDYHQNDIDSVAGIDGSGTARAGSLMLSGYYDFFNTSRVQPFIGAGAGVSLVDADGVTPLAGSIINDDDIAFAYQAMAGIAVNVGSRTKVTLGYRFFAVPDLNLRTVGGTAVDADYQTHEVMLGVRFSFGPPSVTKKTAPPAAIPELPQMLELEPEPEPEKPMARAAPAPKPVPEPEISRNFIVFFDWNRADITSLAQNIITSAVAESKRIDKVRIKLTGHADRSGASRYNRRLSMRRSDIAIIAKGESDPLVTTGDGVREPQNRRVEIILE